MSNALYGRRVLVTRPAAQAKTLCRLIREQDGEAIELPAIDIRPPENTADVEERLARIETYDLGIFVSRNAVIWTKKLLGDNRYLLGEIPLLAIGEGTANELSRAGFDNVEHVAGRSDSEALLQLPVLQEKSVRDKNILVFRGEDGREVLTETLRKRGASVDYAEVYRRVVPVYSAAEINRAFGPKAPDIVVVTSSEGLKNLLGMLSSEWRERLLKSQLVTIGDRIAELTREEGFQNTPVVAEHATDEGLLAAILEIAGDSKKNDRSGKNN